MRPLPIARWSDVPDREPVGALVGNVDLVIVRFDDEHSVLYGRCDHRGALLADGTVRGDDLVCGVHGWDYGIRTGISSYNNDERLAKFTFVGRRRPGDGRRRRDRRVGARASPALRPQRVPGRLPGRPRHPRRTPRRNDPRTRGERTHEARSSRADDGDGRSPRSPPGVGRHPDRDGAARPTAAPRRRPVGTDVTIGAIGRSHHCDSTSRCSCRT